MIIKDEKIYSKTLMTEMKSYICKVPHYTQNDEKKNLLMLIISQGSIELLQCHQ
jgi:hypothetical protein